MKTFKISLIVILFLALTAGVSYATFFGKSKVAYVNTYMIYNEFKLKKELEKKLEKTRLARQVLLDSIKTKIQLVAINKEADPKLVQAKIEELRRSYFMKEKQFAEENENQSQQYTNQVWDQLNQYIKEYGTEKGFDFILGATGQGSLMYAKDNFDVSKELTQYVNNRYDGNK
ncbi:MAG: OmpH family outer membrane protein [Bacteroidia bacterium]